MDAAPEGLLVCPHAKRDFMLCPHTALLQCESLSNPGEFLTEWLTKQVAHVVSCTGSEHALHPAGLHKLAQRLVVRSFGQNSELKYPNFDFYPSAKSMPLGQLRVCWNMTGLLLHDR